MYREPLPTSGPDADFLPPSFSDAIFQGESPDEHAARIQVSAGERRDAVHRRQPHSRRTRAQERSALFVQGDESFLMESLSIHLLSYHHNHRQLTAPLKYPRLTESSIATDLRDRSQVKDLKSIVILMNLIATMHCRICIYMLIVEKKMQ